MAAYYYPQCDAPHAILIEQQEGALRVRWKGVAQTFKLKYRRQEEGDDSWQVLTMEGGGATGGSGYYHDNPYVEALPLQAASSPYTEKEADFTVPGVSDGVYALRLFNICPDGSDYYEAREFTVVTTLCPPIQNLRLVAKSELELRVEWDDQDSGFGPYYISWNDLDAAGRIVDGNTATTETSGYTIRFPKSDRLLIKVQKQCTLYSTTQSEDLLVFICRCGGSSAGAGGGDHTPEPGVVGAAAAYVHHQAYPADTWLVEHYLGFFPNVLLTNSAGVEISGVAQYIDQNTMSIQFGKPVAGQAYLS